MIVVDHLCKQFDQLTAVNDLSFSVAPGEILGFLGPNGAGKSTTMKMLTGFIQPSSGQITVLGHDVATDAIGAQKRIGYLPEGAPCYEEMTPRDFLGFIAEVREIKLDERAARIDRVVDTLALQPVLDQKIETLSKGFKRRVGLAQAIIHDPDVLILDEPTDGLDPNQKHQVRKLIEGLSRDKIVIISTHILEEVTAVCTRAIIVAEGQLVSDCSPAELEAKSRHHGALTLAFDDAGLAESVAGKLRSVASIATVEVTDATLCVLPEGDSLPLDNVIAVLHESEATPKQMFQERGRLDEVFRQITGGNS